MNRVQFLGLTALALGANGPELPGMAVSADIEKRLQRLEERYK